MEEVYIVFIILIAFIANSLFWYAVSTAERNRWLKGEQDNKLGDAIEAANNTIEVLDAVQSFCCC